MDSNTPSNEVYYNVYKQNLGAERETSPGAEYVDVQNFIPAFTQTTSVADDAEYENMN